MEINEQTDKDHVKSLPFNNLFLNAGVVNGNNHWAIYVLGVFSAIMGYFVCQIILFVPLIAVAMKNGITLPEMQAHPEMLFDPDKIGINKNVLLAMLFGMFVFAIAGLLIVIKKVHHKSIKSVITAYDSIRFKRFFFAFGLWSVFIIILTIIQYFIDKESFTLQFKPFDFFILLIICVTLLPIQTSTEEIIFRGYLMQGLSQVFKNGIIPLIITSLMFGIMHMNNPEAKAYGWLTMLPYYSLFGFFLGAITLLDEGLELALGIHCANNLITGLLVSSPNGVLKTDSIFAVTAENPSGELLTWFIIASLTFIIFWQKYRWKNFNLLIK